MAAHNSGLYSGCSFFVYKKVVCTETEVFLNKLSETARNVSRKALAIIHR
jgi:hypothetical protein